MGKVNKQRNKKNRKGFTLIELLAVIIILGVLLLIAVPSISKYIEESRQKTYVNTLNGIVNSVSTSINSLEFPLPKQGEVIIVPFSEIELEQGSTEKSPYGRYVPDKSYVVVSYNENIYNYYVVALDDKGFAIPFVNYKDLSAKSITSNSNTINNNIYSLNDIYKNTPTQISVDTDNMTIRAYDKVDNIIRAKITNTIYSKGDRIKLKDGTMWYVTKNSDEDSKTVTLLSYYHMNIHEHLGLGTQSNTKVANPDTMVVYDASRNPVTNSFDVEYNENADIYAISQTIISGVHSRLLGAGIDISGATIDMPTKDTLGCPSIGTCKLDYCTKWGDKGFWTRESKNSFVVAVDNTCAVTSTSPSYGSGNEAGFGLRVVIKDLQKSNIDKAATKALN